MQIQLTSSQADVVASLDLDTSGDLRILPGLVDVHAHPAIAAGGATSVSVGYSQARAQLNAGVTVLREAGSSLDTHFLDDCSDAPWIVRSGQHIALKKRYLRGYAVELDSPADLPAEIVRQGAAGDGWVKLIGDWIDRSAGSQSDLMPLWPREALIDGVAAAHEQGVRVAVHAFGEKCIDDLLDAGVDCIEHGNGMNVDHMITAKERGVAVTPTLLQAELFADFAQAAGTKYPVYAQTMQSMYDKRISHFCDLVDSGVQLLPGTDAGGYQRHGWIWRELLLWRDYGMDDAEILRRCTHPAREFLRAPEPLNGADGVSIVCFRSDPAKDIAVLKEPFLVLHRGCAFGALDL